MTLHSITTRLKVLVIFSLVGDKLFIMKKLFQRGLALSKRSVSYGFTLVELLIVIAIIGILAVAVLVALDPVEQTNRATDVQFTTAQGEVKNAIQRYYAGKLKYPWCGPSSGGTACTTWINASCTTDITGQLLSGGCAAAVLAELVSAGELKSTLSTTVQGRLRLTTSGTGANYFVSFDPISKNESTFESNGTFFTDLGCTVAGTAVTCTGASVCYQCVN